MWTAIIAIAAAEQRFFLARAAGRMGAAARARTPVAVPADAAPRIGAPSGTAQPWSLPTQTAGKQLHLLCTG